MKLKGGGIKFSTIWVCSGDFLYFSLSVLYCSMICSLNEGLYDANAGMSDKSILLFSPGLPSCKRCSFSLMLTLSGILSLTFYPLQHHFTLARQLHKIWIRRRWYSKRVPRDAGVVWEGRRKEKHAVASKIVIVLLCSAVSRSF